MTFIPDQLCASDATTLANAPSRNFANEALLSVMSGTNFRLTYMYFNRPFPLGATIVSATLRLHQRGVRSGGTRIVTVKRLAAAWKESTINSNNRPGYTGAATSVSKGNGGVDGDVWEFDVSAQLQEVADGAPWYGFRVEGNIASLQYFYARQSAKYHATLDIEWADSPDKPSILAPSNGRAVSIPRPTLRFDFTDVSGDTSMDGYQLQMNQGMPDAVSPDYDSGVVDGINIPEHLVTFDVNEAEVWYWRVTVKDGAGEWSDYSDWTSFTRTAKTPVAITNPAVAPDNFVSEATPPISWSAAGQTAYQVFILDADDLTEVLWTTGKVTSTDTSVNIPDRLPAIITPDGTYVVVVRIWDDVARESTPTDPVYTDASREFTFDLSTETAPVTSFTVSANDPRPGATLGWVRSTAPDSYTVLRRVYGTTAWTVIAANLTAADYLVAGTTYSFIDITCPPRIRHEWSVVAVDNGISSDDNPVDDTEASPKGIWLSKLDGSDAVCIASAPGDNGYSFQASENSAIYYPLGASNPIIITQAVHGRTGAVSGYFKDVRAGLETISRADQIEAFERLRSPAGQTLSLTLVDTATRVFIYNTLVEPGNEFSAEIPVSFELCELI